MKLVAHKKVTIVPAESFIRIIRGRKVILDNDLAELYGVKAIALRQQVKRNLERFPDDFMLKLTKQEAGSLVSQSVIPHKRMLGGSTPYAFTQEGIAMLSSVLRSAQAVQMNIHIMRAFVRMRELVQTNKELAIKVEKLERNHESTGAVIEVLAEDIEKLGREIHWIKNPPLKPKRKIGYIVHDGDE